MALQYPCQRHTRGIALSLPASCMLHCTCTTVGSIVLRLLPTSFKLYCAILAVNIGITPRHGDHYHILHRHMHYHSYSYHTATPHSCHTATPFSCHTATSRTPTHRHTTNTPTPTQFNTEICPLTHAPIVLLNSALLVRFFWQLLQQARTPPELFFFKDTVVYSKKQMCSR
jgi:hypothetical protein